MSRHLSGFHIVAVLILGLLILTGCDNKEQEESPAVTQTHEGILDIQIIETQSGIKAWLVEDHSVPLISMHFAFRGAGAALDPIDKQGLTQLASNTFDEGAGDYDAETFQKTLTDNSISLRFVSRRDYFGGTLKTLTRKKDLGFHLLNQALLHPRFDAAPLERMRNANIARLKHALSDPDWIAARFINDIAYEGHPYAMNSGGTLETLQNITAADLHKFAQTRLSRDNLMIGIVGDLNESEAKDLIDSTFGDLPETSDLPKTAKLALQNKGTTTLHEMDIPQSVLRMVLPAPAKDDPHYFSAQVMNYILGGGGFGSRLMEEIREKRGLTYGIYSYLFHMNKIDTLVLSTSTKTESTAEMLSVIRQEIKHFKDNGPTEKELDDAKSYIVGSMPLGLTSTDKISSLLLSLQIQGLPVDYLDQAATGIGQVTTENVTNAARTWLNEDDFITMIVGNPDQETLQIDTVREDIPNAD